MSSAAKSIYLPWHQAERYWLCFIPHDGDTIADVMEALAPLGAEKGVSGEIRLPAPRAWSEAWNAAVAALSARGLVDEMDEAAVIAGDPPDAEHVRLGRKSLKQCQDIADSLWLGEAILEDRVTSYLQPVLSGKDKVYGYESFARVRVKGKEPIGGQAIVRASRALGMEYAIDRVLQINAIKTFVSSGCSGFLFINFFPGFIQRPEVYLEGLSETVRSHGVIAKHIVLDFTRSEAQQDLQHLQRVTDYCRGRGYAIALDDVETAASARLLVDKVRPDYLKLDMALVKKAEEAAGAEAISEILRICSASGTVTIAEGVETEESFARLKAMGVDLFQGYLFAPPLSVEELKQNSRTA